MPETKAKSRWCERCKRRHDVNHEHFKDSARDRTADTVTGSKSAQDLAQKAADGKPSTLQARVAVQKFQAEQDAVLRELSERRWARRARILYSGVATILDDPKIKLSDEEVLQISAAHADFDQAWGIQASGKIGATIDVLSMHMVLIAARSKWTQELLDSLKKKEADDELPADDPRRAPPVGRKAQN
jgi:hypothetical protein